ncbi:hypothetical protein ACU5AY_05030 [Rhizobium sp. PAMB 3174]
MFNPTYLVKSRNGVYHLRWPIPKQLHPKQKQSSLKLSLGLRDPRQALRLSRYLSHIGDQINEYGIAVRMSYQEVRALLKNHFSTLLEQRRKALDENGPMLPSERQVTETSVATAEQAIADNVPLNFLTGDNDTATLAGIIKKYGAGIAEGTKEYGLLRSDLRIAYRDYLSSLLTHDDELRKYDFSSPVKSGSDKSPSGDASTMTIAKLAEAYSEEKKLSDSWVAKTILEKEDHIALLKEVLGAETDVASITPMFAKQVKDTLIRYPKNRSKSPETRGKPLEEVLKLRGVPTIKIPTINKYLQTYNDMFEWGRRNGFFHSNCFSGLTIRQKNKKDEGRQPFSAQQMASILEAVFPRHPNGATRRSSHLSASGHGEPSRQRCPSRRREVPPHGRG